MQRSSWKRLGDLLINHKRALLFLKIKKRWKRLNRKIKNLIKGVVIDTITKLMRDEDLQEIIESMRVVKILEGEAEVIERRWIADSLMMILMIKIGRGIENMRNQRVEGEMMIGRIETAESIEEMTKRKSKKHRKRSASSSKSSSLSAHGNPSTKKDVPK